MKIAFLTSEYPHPKANFAAGIGTSIMNLSTELVNQGHQVSVILYGQNNDEAFLDNGIEFYKIKNIKFKGFSRYLTQKKIQGLINNLVSNGKVEIIEAADWTGITSNIKLNCPIVVKLHGTDTYFCHLDNRPVKFINKLREKRALKRADARLSVSYFVADVTKKIFSLSNNFEVIPNGINLEKFSSDNSGLNKEQNYILYFGTLIRKKGLLELPSIFNEVYKVNKEIKLILVGRDASDILTKNTSTWEIMKSQFDKEALKNVEYIGSVSYQEINEYIQNAMVCVFPSFAEALPVSWIEAMALRKAIVASNIGWAKEVIDDDLNGFLVNPKDHKMFANKILKLLNDSKKREDFGERARKKVEKTFSIDIVARQNVDYYRKVLELKK
jgi:glycosyltransferase involved in cell wall biosynthesis